MANPIETASLIASVFTSAKFSIERSVRMRPSSREIETAAEVVGKIERLRFPIQAIARKSSSRYGVDDFTRNLDIAGHGLSELMTDDQFRDITSDIRFRPQLPSRIPVEPGIAEQYPLMFSDTNSVYEAMSQLLGFMDEVRSDKYLRAMFDVDQQELSIDASSEESRINLTALKKIVPAQKIAPVQFKIEGDRILIDRKPSLAEKQDEHNIENAKQKILEDSNEIIDRLRSSNCDKRLIENIEALQESISSDDNAIRIGVGNISFGIISAVFKDELPEAINASLQAHNLSINMYVSQFPDWIRFSENALAAELTPEDTTSVRNGVTKVIEYLEDNPVIAEPGVSKAFRNLRRTLDNPNQTNKKSTFAVIRTAENLFSKVFHYAIDYFEKLTVDTAKELHKTAVKGLAVTIVTLAISGATELSSISTRVKELSWLKNAIEIVEKQIRSQSHK